MNQADTILPRRGALTGAAGEITVSDDGKTIYSHDGITPGGFPAGSGAGSSSGGKWTAGTLHDGCVATRAKAFNDAVAGQYFNSRSLHYARSTITAMGLDLANWYVTSAHAPLGERSMGQDCTATATVEYPLGTIAGRFTLNGDASMLLGDGCTTSTDLLEGLNIPAGALFAIREFRDYGNDTVGVPCGYTSGTGMSVAAGEAFEYGDGLADRTGDTGTFASTAAPIFSRPITIWGPTTDPTYGIVGDSRQVGLGDDVTTAPYLDCGESARSVGPLRGYTTLAFVGESLVGVLGQQIPQSGGTAEPYSMIAQGFALRAAIIRKRCTHVISNYGVNDIYAATNPPNLQQVLALQDQLRQMFPNVWWYELTIPGWTVPGTPTETWSASTLAETNTVNNHLLSGFADNDGTFDIASVVQGPNRKLGLWTEADYVIADGIHESPAGCAAIAASGVIQVQ